VDKVRRKEIFHGGGIIQKIFPISEQAILRKHQVLLRKTEYYKNTNKRIRFIILKIRLTKMQNKYALHIPINTCGKGLKIMHIGPVLMNGKVTVGQDCSFHINTALVAGGTNDDVPCLGNRVVVGIGAVVLGGVTLADYIAIGANAVVNKSFDEQDIAIAGVPAKKVSNNGTTHWNVKNKVNNI
jgi:serine O-acetyltransferase